MNRAHGHAALALALAPAIVLATAGEVRAVDVTCADASKVEVVSLDALLSGGPATAHGGAWRRADMTEISFGLLCGPRPLLYGAARALIEGFSGPRPAPGSAPRPFGTSAFDVPDFHRPSDWLPAGSEADLMITGSPLALAVGEAKRAKRVIATVSLGPGSVYNGLHFSPIMSLRVRPDRLRVEDRAVP